MVKTNSNIGGASALAAYIDGYGYAAPAATTLEDAAGAATTSSIDVVALAIDNTGYFISCCTYYDYSIYYTINGGFTWKKSTFTDIYGDKVDILTSWTCMTSNKDNIFLAASTEGHIVISNNFGASWILINYIKHNITSISISLNGQYICVGTYDATNLFSSDYGVTWIQPKSVETVGGISCDTLGQNVVLVPKYGYPYISIGYAAYNILTNYNSFLNNKKDNTLSLNWRSVVTANYNIIAGGYTGTTEITGHIYISNDLGNTWTVTDYPNLYVSCIVSDESGNNLAATMDEYIDSIFITSYIYTSTDGGNNWKISFGGAQYQKIPSITSDATGKILAFAINSSIANSGFTNYFYTSINGGDTWFLKNNP